MVLRDLENFAPAYCNGASRLRKIRACLLLWCFGTSKNLFLPTVIVLRESGLRNNSFLLTVMVLSDLHIFIFAYYNGAIGLQVDVLVMRVA